MGKDLRAEHVSSIDLSSLVISFGKTVAVPCLSRKVLLSGVCWKLLPAWFVVLSKLRKVCYGEKENPLFGTNMVVTYIFFENIAFWG